MGEGRAEEQEELILNTPLSLKQEGSKGKGPWGGVRVIFTGKGKENVIPPPLLLFRESVLQLAASTPLSCVLVFTYTSQLGG